MGILIPNDRQLSRQDRFNNYARNAIERLTVDVVGLQHMFLAFKQVMNISDEAMESAMKSVADQITQVKEQLNVEVPEGAETAVHEDKADTKTEDVR